MLRAKLPKKPKNICNHLIFVTLTERLWSCFSSSHVKCWSDWVFFALMSLNLSWNHPQTLNKFFNWALTNNADKFSVQRDAHWKNEQKVNRKEKRESQRKQRREKREEGKVEREKRKRERKLRARTKEERETLREGNREKRGSGGSKWKRSSGRHWKWKRKLPNKR